ncbi:MAG: sodium:solute symporter [Ruminococcaceae bacterium]|nr:sodium:solute symporter [Oscillospiraceae bacterium]
MTQIIAIAALVVFAAILVVIGITSSKKSATLDGFLLGGRNIGAWLSAFSYGTTYFSAVIFIGYAGKHGWDVGLGAMWIGVGNAILGALLAWIFLANKTRKMTQKLDSRTMPEFFCSRYGSNGMKIYSAIIIFIFLVPYAATVYKGLGSLFGSIFPNDILGMSPTTVCMLIVAVLAAVYLILGGYIASAISNLIQGIVMIAGVVIMCIALVNNPNVGGFSNAVKALGDVDPQLTSVFGGDNWSFLLSNILLTSFGTWGLPQMVHKYYAIKDEHEVKKGAVISTLFCLIIGCGAYFAGSLGRFFISANESGAPDIAGGYDSVVPTMLNSAFSTSFMGNILLSVILLCVLSASMSTLTSIVLTSSTAITVDLAGVFRKNKEIDAIKQMLITRILCFAFIGLSLIFALFDFSIIVTIMSFSWGVVSGCFLGPYFWGLYSKKTTRVGAWCGILSGIVVFAISFILSNIVPSFTFNVALTGVVAMATSFVVVPLVSSFTKKLPDEIVAKAFD